MLIFTFLIINKVTADHIKTFKKNTQQRLHQCHFLTTRGSHFQLLNKLTTNTDNKKKKNSHYLWKVMSMC